MTTKEEKEKKKEKEEKKTYVNKKGLRLDGRTIDQLREIKIMAGVLPRANGSAYIEWGQNKILASVHGPREAIPRHTANPYKAIVRFDYRMATFSVPERKNPKPGRRDIEISKVCGEALEKAIFLEQYPNTAIDVWVEVLDSNAGSRVASLTAAAVAVADAGIPMRDLISSVAVGRIDGTIVLDLNKDEEDAPDAVDMPLGILPNTKEIVLLQMDGLMKKEEFDKAFELGIQGCMQVYQKQIEALKKKYSLEENIVKGEQNE